MPLSLIDHGGIIFNKYNVTVTPNLFVSFEPQITISYK